MRLSRDVTGRAGRELSRADVPALIQLSHGLCIQHLQSPPAPRCGELCSGEQGGKTLAGRGEVGVGEVRILGSSGVCDVRMFFP